LSKELENTTSSKLRDVYVDSNYNIITLLQHLSNGYKCLLWQQNIDKLLASLKKEKKQLNVIMLIRDNVYKLFHIGVPLKDICKYIIKTNINKKNIDKLIACAADCEHFAAQGKKDILLYEKFFLNVYVLL
jgi:hypothetical protein